MDFSTSTTEDFFNDIIKEDAAQKEGETRKISTPPSDDNPDIQIIFREEDCMNAYKAKLEACLQIILRNNEKFIITSKSSKSEDKIEDENSFCIDVSPSSTTHQQSSSTISFSLIKHITSFSTPLGHHSSETKQESKDLSAHLSACFNCNGSHHLKDCPEKYNASHIARNRRTYFASRVRSRRYHLSDELLSCGKFQPGQISKKLRRALGVRRSELPPYIYNMRLFGYPPGWLEEAKIEASGIQIYDSEAKEGRGPDSETDGEKGKMYDGNKFIKYPGFNVPVPPGVKDEWKRYGSQPMAQHQSLSEALKHNNVTTTALAVYKKRKLSSTAVKPVKKPKRPRTDYSSGECTTTDDSELENEVEKPKTLAEDSIEFKDGPIQIDKKSLEDSGIDQNSSNGTLSESETKSTNEQNGKSPAIISSPIVKSCVPIFDTPNPIKKLPDYKNFSEGVSEHENFENLPNSTGSYERIRKILALTKKRLSCENEE